MNKLFTKIATLSVGLAMAVGVGVALASSNVKAMPAKAAAPYDFSGDTVTFSNQGLENGVAYKDPFSSEVFSIQFGGGGNDGKYYTTGSGIRTYGNGYFTVSAVSGALTKLEFTWDGSSYKPTSSDVASVGTFGSPYNEWTGNAESVTFTRPSGSGHWRLQSVKATVSSEVDYVNVTGNITNGSLTETQAIKGSDFVGHIVPNSGYSYPESLTSVTMGGSAATYSYENGAVTIENVTGDIAITATCPALPTPEHAGTSADPYTVEDAFRAIDLGTGLSGVYASGIISQVDSYSEQYKSITYWISDDGTTTKQLEVYSGKGLNGADFSAVTDVTVGASVVVTGTLKKYNSTYEFDKNNQLVTYVEPVRVLTSISLSGTYKTEFEVGDAFDHEGLVVTAHYEDTTTKDVSSSATFSGFDSSAVAESQEITVSYTENEVTKTAKYNVSIVAPIVKHTITFNAGGGSGTMDPVQVNDGADYTLPECGFTAPEGQKFENWSVGGTRRDPGYVIEGVNEDIELIALWADIEMAIYEKVTTELEDYSGTYLIVYEGDADHGKFAFNGSLAKLDAIDNGTSITIANFNTEATEDNEFTIAKSGDYYSIKAANGKYIGQNSDANGLTESETALNNNISFDGGIVIRSSGGAHLRYNYASNQNRFRYYKSTSYEGQQAIALYKKVTYTAAAFAQKLLDDTKALCDAFGPTSDYDSYKAQLTTIWSTLSGSSYYGQLGVTGKALLKDIEGDEGGELIAQALARYDYLTSKYELDNFITGRIVSGLANVTTPITVSESNSTTAMIVVTIVALTSVSAIAVLLVIKRRKSI